MGAAEAVHLEVVEELVLPVEVEEVILVGL